MQDTFPLPGAQYPADRPMVAVVRKEAQQRANKGSEEEDWSKHGCQWEILVALQMFYEGGDTFNRRETLNVNMTFVCLKENSTRCL